MQKKSQPLQGCEVADCSLELPDAPQGDHTVKHPSVAHRPPARRHHAANGFWACPVLNDNRRPGQWPASVPARRHRFAARVAAARGELPLSVEMHRYRVFHPAEHLSTIRKRPFASASPDKNISYVLYKTVVVNEKALYTSAHWSPRTVPAPASRASPLFPPHFVIFREVNHEH